MYYMKSRDAVVKAKMMTVESAPDKAKMPSALETPPTKKCMR